jgi:hypothetical protein
MVVMYGNKDKKYVIWLSDYDYENLKKLASWIKGFEAGGKSVEGGHTLCHIMKERKLKEEKKD